MVEQGERTLKSTHAAAWEWAAAKTDEIWFHLYVKVE